MDHAALTVQIMAGGQSLRMGRDKAGLALRGRSLLERAIQRWDGWGHALVVAIGGMERAAVVPPGIRAVFDERLGCGPLEGFYRGALACRTELLLLCAVDTPFLTPAHAAPLCAAIGQADACVYTIDGRPQPLFGLYRPARCAAVAQALLDSGARKMRLLLDRVDTVTLPAPDPAAFLNINTPQELRAADARLAQTQTGG